MKILYIFMSASKNSGSVQSKVLSEISGLIANGVECNGLFFTTDNTSEICTVNNIRFVQVPSIKSSFFKFSKQKSAYFKALNEFPLIEQEYDYIYIRYPGANIFLLNFLKKLKTPFFFEHITSELEELKLYKIENPFKWNVSSILSHLEFYYLPVFREYVYGPKVRSLASFGVCNSFDISYYQKRVSSESYKTIILGDAVDTSQFEIKNSLLLDKEFRMLFLKGASTQAHSNGIDRILNGIKKYNGKYSIKFYLYGKNLKFELDLIKKLGIESSVITGTYLKFHEINEISNFVHIGFGRLAIHRKGQKSNSTIKTREYFAMGLPFVYGHHDPDFSDSLEARNYCKLISADDSPIDLVEIIEWYNNMNFSKVTAAEMHNFSLKYLDYKVKMNKLILFIKDHSNNQRR